MASFRIGLSVVTACQKRPLYLILEHRGISQLSHLDGESLWKSVRADVKKVGGRGKRTKKRKTTDLGRDKRIGEGKLGYLWPGLNVNVDEQFSQRTPEEQTAYLQKRKEQKDKWVRTKHWISPLMRGWTGGLWGGQEVLAQDEAAQMFKSYLLEARRVSHMSPSVGRVYSIRAMVAVGNANGTFGIDMETAGDVATASRKARMKALKRLRYVERYEDRTVFEDMYVNHHRTFMYIRQQPDGYGLRCHRAVMTLCRLIGLKDLYVCTRGAKTMLSLVKCFTKALQSQETYQQQADRLGYHVVQCDPLRDNYPVVLASPSDGQVKTDRYDEYYEYLNRPLIAREVRKGEGWHRNPWRKVMTQTNQGPPVPNHSDVPSIITSIKDETIEDNVGN